MNVENLTPEELQDLRTKILKEYKDSVQEKRAELTEDELAVRRKAISRQLKINSNSSDLLGDVNADPNFVYKWHTITKDSDIKLKRRFDMGYALAPKEDIEKLNIGSSSTYGKVKGSSAVLANHGSHQAVLLRIPKEHAVLNQQIKDEMLAAERKQKKVTKRGNTVIEHEDHGTKIYG